tara:strand:- start:113 stop:577 length:465 start_codon:yes stop_codon:yes gene_type:complete
MKGIIYYLTNGEEYYYGSTSKKYLASRVAGHKYDIKMGHMQHLKCIVENENFSYHLIKTVEVENLKELRNIEKEYITNNECINKQTPCITRKESQAKYRSNNQDKIKKHFKDVLKERRKTQFKYCEICDKTITSNNFSSHKKSKKHMYNIHNDQ